MTDPDMCSISGGAVAWIILPQYKLLLGQAGLVLKSGNYEYINM
jgi:hypothetical protein